MNGAFYLCGIRICICFARTCRDARPCNGCGATHSVGRLGRSSPWYTCGSISLHGTVWVHAKDKPLITNQWTPPHSDFFLLCFFRVPSSRREGTKQTDKRNGCSASSVLELPLFLSPVAAGPSEQEEALQCHRHGAKEEGDHRSLACSALRASDRCCSVVAS
jgi:hypothetical protein